MATEQEYSDDVEVKEVSLEAIKEEAPVKDIEEEIEQEGVQEEYNERELEAMSKGWKPEGVEGKPKLSADEFLRNEEFFDKIARQNRTIRKLEATMDEMAKQHTKLAELERNKLLDDLKAKKKKALAEEDYDSVVDLDEQIAIVRDEKVEEKPEKSSPNIDPEFNEWQSKNTWYDPNTNPSLFKEATALGQAYNNMTGAVGLELYEYVERTMKRLYPEQLGTQARQHAPAVEGGRKPVRKASTKKVYTKNDLNDVQRSVMNRFVKTGVMTEQEYIEELVKIGELG